MDDDIRVQGRNWEPDGGRRTEWSEKLEAEDKAWKQLAMLPAYERYLIFMLRKNTLRKKLRITGILEEQIQSGKSKANLQKY